MQDSAADLSTSGDFTSGLNIVTSSIPEAGSSGVKIAAARAKRKSGGVVRQHDNTDAAGGVVGCHGNQMTSSVAGVVKDEQDDEELLNSSASLASLRELELAAAAGRTSNGKLDNVKARFASVIFLQPPNAPPTPPSVRSPPHHQHCTDPCQCCIVRAVCFSY